MSEKKELKHKHVIHNQSHALCRKIDVERDVTKEEIEKDPERWRGYYVGSHTNAFLTKEEAIETAKRIIKARFHGDWKIEIEDMT